MKLLNFFKYLTVDPVNFSIKAKLLSFIACFCSIFLIALVSKLLSPWPESPILVASMGASAIILFFIPSSPLAQPWPFIGGQLSSAAVGVFCALHISEPLTAQASAVGGSILIMLLLRCLHPPGAATSLTPVMMSDTAIQSLNYSFVFIPVAINVLVMLLLTVFINRWVLKKEYPTPLPIKKQIRQRHTLSEPSHIIGFSETDINQALKTTNLFIDITPAQLSQLLLEVETSAFKRIKGTLLCRDIMIRDVITVEYGTEVEHAWKLMNQHHLKALPVIDRAQRVIGILTWNDFLKCIDLNAYESIQQKFRQFIQRTQDISASKPESVGFIMTTEVLSLDENTHIVELIQLMSIKGHRQIPIVNAEQRLVGMVYQANLIAALYNQQLAAEC